MYFQSPKLLKYCISDRVSQRRFWKAQMYFKFRFGSGVQFSAGKALKCADNTLLLALAIDKMQMLPPSRSSSKQHVCYDELIGL